MLKSCHAALHVLWPCLVASSAAAVANAAASAVAVAFTACGAKHCHFFIDAFKTFVGQALLDHRHAPLEHKLRVYLVVDPSCDDILRNNGLLVPQEMIDLSIIALSAVPRIGNTSKACPLVKLVLPDIVPERWLLHFDSDVLFAQSVRPLQQFAMDAFETSAWPPTLLMAENTRQASCLRCGWYWQSRALRDQWGVEVHAGVNGFNSGVLAVDVLQWRQRKVLDTLLDIRGERGVKFPLDDQDMLNLLARRNPSLLWAMPCQFNWRREAQCHDRCAPRAPVVLHESRAGRLPELHDLLLWAAAAVLEGEIPRARDPTTLWDISEANASQLPMFISTSGWPVPGCVDEANDLSPDSGPVGAAWSREAYLVAV